MISRPPNTGSFVNLIPISGACWQNCNIEYQNSNIDYRFFVVPISVVCNTGRPSEPCPSPYKKQQGSAGLVASESNSLPAKGFISLASGSAVWLFDYAAWKNHRCE